MGFCFNKVLRALSILSYILECGNVSCLFCNTFVDFIFSPLDGVQVKTTEFSLTMKEISEKRVDEWGYIVHGWIHCKMSDLHAHVYHRS